MRLIDADELIKNLIHVSPECDEFGRGVATGISTAILEIYNLPFLALDDMRPKGRWVEYENEADRGYHYCSECKHQAFNYDEGDCNVEILSDYCPNCGARMEVGDKNDE